MWAKMHVRGEHGSGRDGRAWVVTHATLGPQGADPAPWADGHVGAVPYEAGCPFGAQRMGMIVGPAALEGRRSTVLVRNGIFHLFRPPSLAKAGSPLRRRRGISSGPLCRAGAVPLP